SQVPDRLAKGQLKVVRRSVEQFLDAQDDDPEARLQRAVDLATALVALAVGNGDDNQLDDELAQAARRSKRDGDVRTKTDRKFDARDRSSRGGSHRYWIGVGHRDRVKPGAIVGAITSEGGLRGQDLGQVEIFSNFSIVEIAPELSHQTLRRLSQTRVAGRPLGLRPDLGQRQRKSRY
ncbi:MAG: DbpA RNA binding domain-containing protein, partial [Propionibacteriaceae bacterium]|nr:DbpA RNA binding domain-containing protein [Propionibacteriaceae bacterium]